ncbi:MAG: FGGY-family carbohydrate kinase [Clostridia bacterium]
MVLAIDLGTQSLRAMIIDDKGEIISKAQIKFDSIFKVTQSGWAEQDPQVYWNALCSACNQLKNKEAVLWKNIDAMSVTTFRDSYVCLDEDGNPLRDAILWLDQREAKCDTLPLPLMSKLAFKIIGMSPTLYAQRKITKSNWIIENQPEIWAKTYKYMLISGYINYKLTGKFADAIANQIGHIPFDYKNKRWKKTNDLQYPMFNVPPQKLCEIVDSGDVLGCVCEKAAKESGIRQGLYVIATGSDKGCETLGCGVLQNDVASLSFGTSATVQFSTKKYFEPQSFLPSYPAVAQDYYNPEIQIFRGYWMLTWFIKQFAEKEIAEAADLGVSTEQVLNKFLDDVPVGCDGLMLQPYWSPLLQYPEARGSIIGFKDIHTKAHIYRAIIEGIGYALMDGLKTMERRSNTEIKSLTIGGGGSQSDTICQITADMFGLPIRRIQTYETCALGCALASYVAIGRFKTYEEAIENMVHYQQPFMPIAIKHNQYEHLYEKVYKNVYPKLRPFYKLMY